MELNNQFFSRFRIALIKCIIWTISIGHNTSIIAQKTDFIVQTNHYTYTTGLSNNHVFQTFTDSRGIVWILRDNGLDRFDGLRFKSIDLPEIINSDKWGIILEDSDHNLWMRDEIGTPYFFNILTEVMYSPSQRYQDFPQNLKFAIKANNNSYLVGSSAALIRYKLSGNSTVFFDRAYTPMFEYQDGHLWVDEREVKGGGAFCLVDSKRQMIAKIPYKGLTVTSPGHIGDTVYCATSDTIFAFQKNGLVIKRPFKDFFPGILNIKANFKAKAPKISIDTINNWLWIYHAHDLIVLNRSLQMVYRFNSKDTELSVNYVLGVHAGNQKYAWLSTYSGLYKVSLQINSFTPSLVSADKIAMGMDNQKSCRGITQGYDGLIYVIANPSIYQIMQNGKEKEILRIKPNDAQLLAPLDADEQGNLWFTTSNLHSVEIVSGKVHTYPIQIRGDTWSIKVIDNQVWLGNPLICWDIATQKPQEVAINEFNDILNVIIYDIQPKSATELWLISSKGLYLLNKKKGIVARYWSGGKESYFLPFDDLRHGWEAQAGEWWLATTKGLLKWSMNSQTAHLYGKESGIPANCHAVLPDNKGYLWISTDFGLLQFDKKQERARAFYSSDGLNSDEFNRQSYCKDNYGRIYFGGLNGIVGFDPEKITEDWKAKLSDLHLILTECSIFSGKTNREENKRISVFQSQSVDIYPGDRFLKVQVALTGYKNTERIVYYYRIKGFQETWHSSKEGELFIAALPYGNYTLEIRGIGGGGLESQENLNLKIRVHRPFYLQAWFIVLLLFTGGMGTYWYIKWRTQKLKAQSVLLDKAVQERTQTIDSQQKKIKQMYDLKSRMYANITHEFKTPLTLIIGPANRILPAAKSLPRPEIAQTLEQIVIHSEQMLGLVNQIMDVNKLESNALTPRYHRDDMVTFLARLVEPFQIIAQHRGIQLDYNTKVGEFLIEFDSENAAKILNNLLSNALKFTDSGGYVQVILEATESWCLILVADTGMGIDAAALPFIFDRFYQAENQRSRRSEGTGIGLALVKELTELMEGRIEVNSSLGQGSQFSVLLPLRNASIKQGVANKITGKASSEISLKAEFRPKKPQKRALPKILVVEDNPDIAQFIESCLEEQYDVTVFVNSKQGLALAQTKLPDLIISDIMMPDMDGYEFCKLIKSDERTSHIPVVFLTALQEQIDRIERLEAGADAFISKPFRAEELLMVVASILEQRITLREKYLRAVSGSKEGESLEQEWANQKNLQLLIKVQQIIQENLDDPALNVQVLCRKMGLSQSQLHRKLNALTGMSIGRYVTYIRLEEAKRLLHTKDWSIAEVAFKTGFSDPAYFTRQFAKTFGQSPRQFRESG